MANDVAERTRKVIATVLKVPLERVVPQAQFVKDLGMASIASIELIAALEEEFDVEIDSDNVGDITTVEKSIGYMQKAVAAKK
jgi:acyl carrier protein